MRPWVDPQDYRVCGHVYVRAYVCACVSTCLCACIHVCYVYVHVCVSICISTCMCLYVLLESNRVENLGMFGIDSDILDVRNQRQNPWKKKLLLRSIIHEILLCCVSLQWKAPTLHISLGKWKGKSQIQRKYAQNIDLIIILVSKIHCALLKLHRGLGTGYRDERGPA